MCMYMYNLAFEHQITIVMMSRTDCPELTTWVRELGLTCADKVNLQNGSWLSANHTSAANRRLKRHFPGQNGLQDTCILSQKCEWSSSPECFIQIIFIRSRHWACVSKRHLRLLGLWTCLTLCTPFPVQMGA